VAEIAGHSNPQRGLGSHRKTAKKPAQKHAEQGSNEG